MVFFPKRVFPQNSLPGVNCIINIPRVINILIIYLGSLPSATNIQKRNTCPWEKEKNETFGQLSTQKNFNCTWNKNLGEDTLNTSVQKNKFYCMKSN